MAAVHNLELSDDSFAHFLLRLDMDDLCQGFSASAAHDSWQVAEFQPFGP